MWGRVGSAMKGRKGLTATCVTCMRRADMDRREEKKAKWDVCQAYLLLKGLCIFCMRQLTGCNDDATYG